ncbi:MAG: hypothetical protein AB4040_02960 [Synechococcus sp.]
MAEQSEVTIELILKSMIAEGTLVNTDGYTFDNPLEDWGCLHQTVCHSASEYARNDDGD